MASSREPIIYAYKADAAITKGMAVKQGTDFKHVAKSAANTNKHIGVAQNDAVSAEDVLEVAMPGGGGKGLLSGTCSPGDFLTGDTSGKLIVCDGAGDVVIAQALQDGADGDLIDIQVVLFPASGANA